MKHPYTYRLTLRKTITTKEFELGKGCSIVLNLISDDLLKLLRKIYAKDKFAMEMSPAAATYLLTSDHSRYNDRIPCIAIPKPISLKFQITR